MLIGFDKSLSNPEIKVSTWCLEIQTKQTMKKLHIYNIVALHVFYNSGGLVMTGLSMKIEACMKHFIQISCFLETHTHTEIMIKIQ